MSETSHNQEPPNGGSDQRLVGLSRATLDEMIRYIKSRSHSGSWWNDPWTYELVKKVEAEISAERRGQPRPNNPHPTIIRP